MKTKTTLLIISFLLISGFLTSSFSQGAEELFQKGIQLEEGDGNLPEAIKVYRLTVADKNADRTIRANALYHIGLCYEKLGKTEARKAYQQLVSDFADQGKVVALARGRLNSLIQIAEEVANAPLVPKFTQVKIPTGLSWNIALSPDGKDLVHVQNNKLWKIPVSGNLGPGFPGSPVKINTEGIEVVGGSLLSWSGDGNWIAFNEDPIGELTKEGSNGYLQMYVVSSKGGIPKKVYENFRGQRIINYRMSLSPDGKTLAFSSGNIESKEQHIFTIPVDGGSPKQLVDAQAREPVFSPDGKMIAYVEDKFMGRGGGDLWVVSSEGGTPQHVADAVNASSPVWSPNGDIIAFLDNGKKGNQIYFKQLKQNGESKENVFTIDAPDGVDGIWLLAGWSPDNKIAAIFEKSSETGLYTMPRKGGKAMQVAVGGGQPRWSPDGKRIFCVNTSDKKSGNWKGLAIGSIPAEGGSFTTVPLQSDENMYIPYFGSGNSVSPDGKAILFSGKSQYNSIHFLQNHIWKLPVEGGVPEQLTETPLECTDMFPCWSPDGKTIAFVRSRVPEKIGDIGDYKTNIYMVRSGGGEPTSLTTASDCVSFGPIEWSSDGKFIAFFSKEDDTSVDGTIKIISANGDGKSRVIGTVSDPNPGMQFAWSPDSKHIAFNGPDGKVIKVISLDNEGIVNIETGLFSSVIGSRLDWSPDGENFVFVAGKGESNELWLIEDFLPLDKLAQKNENNFPIQFTDTKLWDDPDTDLEGAPSPDGKYLSYVDWETGDLAIYEMATGEKRRVTNKGTWDESHDFAEYSRWSPDSKQIAYGWYNSKDELFEIRIIEHDGSNPRIICKDKDVDWGIIFDWSPDGANILANLEKKDGTIQMVLISTEDGSVQILKTSVLTATGSNWPENMSFSPDGRYIVFDLPNKDSEDRDIFIMSADGNNEIPVVEHPAIDQALGWAPDGNNIIFISDRTGTPDFWTIKVLNGKPQGKPTLVKSSKGPFSPTRLGFSNDGSFYYGKLTNKYDIYSTEINPETGKIVAAPSILVNRFIESNVTPAYSQDGKYLAYVSRRPPGTMTFTTNPVGNVLCIRSLETGEEKEFRPDINVFGWPRWSPDGHSVIVVNMDGHSKGFFQIDTQNGEVTTILLPVKSKLFGGHTLSPDGKIFTYGIVDYNISVNKSFNCQIIARNINSGEEKVIYQSKYDFRICPSPNGKYLALLSNSDKKMKILPVTGGEPRELTISAEWKDYKFELNNVSSCWSSDGKYVFVLMNNSKMDDSKWELCRISTEDGEIQKLGLEMDYGGFVNPSAHPDGKHICFSSRGISNSEVWVMENFLPKK